MECSRIKSFPPADAKCLAVEPGALVGGDSLCFFANFCAILARCPSITHLTAKEQQLLGEHQVAGFMRRLEKTASLREARKVAHTPA